MTENIYLYCDKGAGAFSIHSVRHYFSGANITPVKASDIITNDIPDDIDLFIMPGGADRPYAKLLNGAGNRAIRTYVENGGTYLGLCAGAYYGCQHIEFQKGTEDEICEPRELAFHKNIARGCLTDIATPYDTTMSSAVLTPINMNGTAIDVLYWGGCTFDGIDKTQTQIIATYQALENQPPAIISCDVGKGKALLSGVHFEATKEVLSNYDFDNQNENDLKDALLSKFKDTLITQKFIESITQ